MRMCKRLEMADTTSVIGDRVISDNGTHRNEGQSGETELIPLEGCSSKIWKYFGFPGKDGQYIERQAETKRSNLWLLLETFQVQQEYFEHALAFKLTPPQ